MNENSKFTPATLFAKKKLRQTRLDKGWTVNHAAQQIGIERKVLEDVEATRYYGCHLSLDRMLQICKAYGLSLNDLVKPGRAR